jgi:hypothetical protein
MAKKETMPDIDKTVGIPQDVQNKSEDTTDQALLQRVMKDFRSARDYVKDNYQDDWEDYWKCYNSMRTRRNYEGISDDFVPETFTIVETLKANIAGGKPKFAFHPMREEQKQETQILNSLLDFYWDTNRMSHKTLNWVQDMILYGNGVLMLSWEGEVPAVTNIPLPDFFVDPTATHLNNPEEPGYPKYCGYRYLTTLDELKKKKMVSPDTGEMDNMYKNLGEIPEMGSDWDELDKDTKEQFLGSTLGKKANKNQIECILYYTKKKKIIIANRRVIIYEGQNPYHREASTKEVMVEVDGKPVKSQQEIPEIKPFLPFAILRNYVDGSLFYAKGDLAQIIDRQETMNDLTNQKHDNITFVLNNMWQIDPQFQHLAEQIESVPGAVYPIPRGALAPIEKQVVTGEADSEIGIIKQEMRAATAADEVIQGLAPEQGRTTATEITTQINQAQQRFATKLNTLESEGYAQVGRIMFKMVQIFVDQPMAVRIIGPQGAMWKDFDPNEYSGDYEPKVELASTIKTHRAQEGQKYLQLHELIAGSPLINQQKFMEIYLDKVYDFSEEEVKDLMNVPPPPPPQPTETPRVNISLTGQLPAELQASVMQDAGLVQQQPSPEDIMAASGQAHGTVEGAQPPKGGAPQDIPALPPGMAQ